MPPVPRELEDLGYADDLVEHAGPLIRQQAIELALFSGRELTGIDAGNTRFLECAFTDSVLSGGSMRRARLNEIWMRRVRVLDVDLAETSWHDVTVLDSSFAALEAYASTLHRVVLQGCKLDSINFRDARLSDVDFVECVVRNVDFAGATLKNVRFPGSTIEGMELTGSALTAVDFSRAQDVELISGAESLRGAVINSGQLISMAPACAGALGIEVVDL